MQKGLNNQKIQQTNRSLILEMIIDRGIVTRKEMIDLTGLHKPTITNIVNELLEMNVIEECEVPRKEGQRKVVGFALKTQKIKILSARWARDFFEVALYTLSGEIIDSERCAVNPEEEIELTANKNLAAIYRLLERHHTSHVLGMCIGVPGPYIKAEKNQALVAGYDNLQKIDIQKYFEDKFPFPVITEHDAHLSAFAEWKSMSQNERNKYNCMLALQSLGIGIGAGVILNGKIVEGAFGVSGEIGQMGILFSGVKNSQGARGKLENYASSSSVKKYVRTRLFEFPESVTLEINEERSYAIIWKYLMKLQEQLPRALMYYGRRDENGVEKNTSKLGIFLPFCHFEHEMEKTVELANGIGLGCREAILAEIKALKNDPKNKTAGV